MSLKKQHIGFYIELIKLSNATNSNSNSLKGKVYA